MKKYFRSAYQSLHPKGVFILDIFGGSACQEANEEETIHETFSYFWDQDSFNPITHDAQFYIHFKPKGGPKKEKSVQLQLALVVHPRAARSAR